MRIAILALQGAFLEHQRILERLGVQTIEIRQRKDLEQQFDGLILPGGESTVQGKLLRDLNLLQPLKEKIIQGLPVYGTCAGLVLLAKNIEGNESSHIGTMDIWAMRNAYGRQLGSFQTQGELKGIGGVPMTFIRAPYIIDVGEGVECLGIVDGKIVAARQNNQLVTSFHPELTEDVSVHQYFINMIQNQ